VQPSALGIPSRHYRWRPNVGVLDSLRFGSPPRPWTRFTYNPDLQATVTRFSARDSISYHFVEPHTTATLRSPGLAEDYGFDTQRRLHNVRVSGQDYARFFAYDSLGRLRRTDFQHDPICQEDPQYGTYCDNGTTDSTHAFSFDAVGNRLDHGGSYTMPGNRITNFDGCSYHTDAEGSDSTRACPGEAATFTWTGDGQLASYTVGGVTRSFAYDPLGRLVRRDSAGVVKSRFLWDGDNLVAELAANGTATVAEYSYYPGGLDNLHAVFVPTGPAYGTWYAHVDAMGNVRALVGDTGLVRRTYNYDEWGRLLPTSGDSAGFAGADRARWKGALWMGPAPDLYYMRNRWYEPRTGRFLSEDPIGLEGGVNQYAFSNGDPVNGRDPTGLDPRYYCLKYGTEYTNTRTGDSWIEWDLWDCYTLPSRSPSPSDGRGPGGSGGGSGGGGDSGDLCEVVTLAGTITVDASVGDAAIGVLDEAAGFGARTASPGGFRTTAWQAEHHALWLAGQVQLMMRSPVLLLPQRAYAAPPGRSSHEAGFAIDIGNWSRLSPTQQVGVVAAAAKYGFRQGQEGELHHFSTTDGGRWGSHGSRSAAIAANQGQTRILQCGRQHAGE